LDGAGCGNSNGAVRFQQALDVPVAIREDERDGMKRARRS
jgi:hypothetical protein